jgi:DNA-binding NarL/FixJ family response regulator
MRSHGTTVPIDRAENEQNSGDTTPQENSEITGPGSGRQEQKITVVISDASQMTSELLARALGRVKTLSVLKSAVTSVEALEAIVDLEPDIAVVSTHQADGLCKGFEVVRQARQLFVKTRCVLLMDDSDHDLVIDAFRAGARGVFRRSVSMNLLGRCISAVHSGQIWASSADLQQVFGELEKTTPLRCVNAQGDVLLTNREQEIVPFVAQGLTNKEISSELGLSEHTVKNHLFRIYEKLGISSRVELILYAVSHHEEGSRSA